MLKEVGGGPEPSVGVIPPPPPSPPCPLSTEVDTTIYKGWLFFLLCSSSFSWLCFI